MTNLEVTPTTHSGKNVFFPCILIKLDGETRRIIDYEISYVDETVAFATAQKHATRLCKSIIALVE